MSARSSRRRGGVALVASACLALIGCSSTASGTASTAPGTASTAPGSASTAPGSASTASGSAAASGSAITPTPVPPSPAARTIAVGIAGRTVTPPPADVAVGAGEAVRLVVTSRAANQVHVHGPDIEKDLPAGIPVTLDLRFTEPGVYEVEAHRPELRLLRFVVR